MKLAFSSPSISFGGLRTSGRLVSSLNEGRSYHPCSRKTDVNTNKIFIISNNNSYAEHGIIENVNANANANANGPITTPASASAQENGKQPLSMPTTSPLAKTTDKGSGPVELRPELVGGVPLWLLFSIGGEIRKALTRLSSASPSTTPSKTDGNDQPQLPPSTALRMVADQLDALQAQLDQSAAQLAERESLVRMLRAQLADRQRQRDLYDERAMDDMVHSTARQLFSSLCSAQSRMAASEQRAQALADQLDSLRNERDAARSDSIKVMIMFAGLLSLFISSQRLHF